MDTITVIRGDSASFDITFKDRDGNPINLTNATVFFTVKSNVTDEEEDALITKDIVDFANVETGVATVVLTPSDISSVGEFFYDVQLKDGEGKISSSGVGRFIVNRDITERTS